MNDLLERAAKVASSLPEEQKELTGTIQSLMLENQALRSALYEISRMGSACEEFEICRHPPCKDSVAACLLALNTLHELDLPSPFAG